MKKLSLLSLIMLVSVIGDISAQKKCASGSCSKGPCRQGVCEKEEGKTRKSGNIIHFNGRGSLDQILSDNDAVVLDFYMEGCGPCKRFSGDLPSISKALPDVVFVKISADASPSIAQRYSANRFPTIILVKDGQEVTRKVGYSGKNDFIKFVQGYL